MTLKMVKTFGIFTPKIHRNQAHLTPKIFTIETFGKNGRMEYYTYIR